MRRILPSAPSAHWRSSSAAWLRECSGAAGDLGTLLPYVLGAIVLVGMDATGVLLGFGLAYLMVACVYRAPAPVQPMKVVGALLLASPVAPATVAATGVLLGGVFLLAAISGVVGTLARRIPMPVTAGLQLGLAAMLAWLALGMLAQQWWLGLGACGLILLAAPRWPAALLVLVGSVAIGQFAGIAAPWPVLDWGWHWPALQWPGVGADLEESLALALAQAPLTLTNAIVVTTAVMARCYPQAHACTPRRLAWTTGAINLIAAPMGGLPMCHGAGGVSAHYRFGARTIAAPLIIGLTLCALAIALGPSAAALLATVPEAALGALLLFAALSLAGAAELQSHSPIALAWVLVVALLCVLWNPALAFGVGWVGWALTRRLITRVHT